MLQAKNEKFVGKSFFVLFTFMPVFTDNTAPVTQYLLVK